MRLIGLLPIALCLIAFACPSSELTESEARKIDARLKPLLEGKTPDKDVCLSEPLPDGTQAYRVIIRGNVEELQKERLHLSPPVGDIMTGTLSRDDIIRAAKLPSVRSIECGSRNSPQ